MHVSLSGRTAAPVRLTPPARDLPAVEAGAPAPLCSTCRLREFCLPCGLDAEDVARLDRLQIARRRVSEGHVPYREGDPFLFVYAVRSGTFKTTLPLRDGRQQVVGFQMAGELLGLDGLASGRHASSAVALEDAEICAIPYLQLSELANASPALQQAISRVMSREIVREHSLMVLLGSMNAEERLAAFLLNISQRMKARGYSALEFHLRMARAEIGSYLGMKVETVSRTFSAFVQQGLLRVDKKHVRIVDLQGLRRALDAHVQ